MTNRSPKAMTFHYAAVACTYWMCYAVLGAFASAYMLDAGLDNATIGFILAFNNIAIMILQPTLAAWSDRKTSPSLAKILFCSAVLLAGVSAGVLLTRRWNVAVCCALYSCGMIFMISLQPLQVALGMETMNQGIPIQYGLCRAGGSAGYAITSYIMGYISEWTSMQSIPIAAFICFLLFALVSRVYPIGKAADIPENLEERGNPLTIREFVVRYKRFTIMLCGVALVYLSHSLISTFMYQILLSRGGMKHNIGVASTIAVCAEMVPMFLHPILSKKVRSDILLRISVVSFLLKIVATYFSYNVFTFYLAQVLQVSAWGLMTMYLVLYINKIVRHEDVAKGQALASMANAAGSVIGCLVGGSLMDIGGAGSNINGMLLFGICAASIGVIIVFVTIQREPD